MEPEQSERVELVLRAGAEATPPAAWRGELRSCDPVGLSVRFAEGPCLPLGSAVRLSLAAETLQPALELEARVESRQDGEGARDYGLCFVRRHEVEARLLPALRALVERRGARRVQADPDEPLLITLECGELPRLAAQLVWLSARGLEVRVPAEEEARWCAVERARAAIALPRGGALAVEVILRSRRLAGRHALLGLELAAPADAAQLEGARALGALVEERRAALERRRAS